MPEETQSRATPERQWQKAVNQLPNAQDAVELFALLPHEDLLQILKGIYREVGQALQDQEPLKALQTLNSWYFSAQSNIINQPARRPCSCCRTVRSEPENRNNMPAAAPPKDFPADANLRELMVQFANQALADRQVPPSPFIYKKVGPAVPQDAP